MGMMVAHTGYRMIYLRCTISGSGWWSLTLQMKGKSGVALVVRQKEIH